MKVTATGTAAVFATTHIQFVAYALLQNHIIKSNPALITVAIMAAT